VLPLLLAPRFVGGVVAASPRPLDDAGPGGGSASAAAGGAAHASRSVRPRSSSGVAPSSRALRSAPRSSPREGRVTVTASC